MADPTPTAAFTRGDPVRFAIGRRTYHGTVLSTTTDYTGQRVYILDVVDGPFSPMRVYEPTLEADTPQEHTDADAK